jgi:diadenosine tetraphosphate (Ap4A) HIT family hydrolase
MIDQAPCLFCTLPEARILLSGVFGVVIRDLYPVSPGHTLIVPRRHVRSFFELTADEREALLELLEAAKRELDDAQRPHGYNIGINDGVAAGQTVPHLHIHLIPRYLDDQPDPRGGIRWIFPNKAKYWG